MTGQNSVQNKVYTVLSSTYPSSWYEVRKKAEKSLDIRGNYEAKCAYRNAHLGATFCDEVGLQGHFHTTSDIYDRIDQASHFGLYFADLGRFLKRLNRLDDVLEVHRVAMLDRIFATSQELVAEILKPTDLQRIATAAEHTIKTGFGDLPLPVRRCLRSSIKFKVRNDPF